MVGLELLCFQIISNVGNARSEFIEAIQAAKMGEFTRAYERVSEGEKSFNIGHEHHAQLIQGEASGKEVGTNLLLIHAEDQLMSAESFKIIAIEFIASYERLMAIEAKVNTL